MTVIIIAIKPGTNVLTFRDGYNGSNRDNWDKRGKGERDEGMREQRRRKRGGK